MHCQNSPPANFPCTACHRNATLYKGECKLREYFSSKAKKYVEETLEFTISFQKGLLPQITAEDLSIKIIDEASNIDEPATIENLNLSSGNKDIIIKIAQPTTTFFKATAVITFENKDKVVYEDQP